MYPGLMESPRGESFGRGQALTAGKQDFGSVPDSSAEG